MGMLSSSGGEDSFVTRLAIFCTVMTMVSTLCVGILLPAHSAYSYEDVSAQRIGLEGFTGESMTNQAPWMLTGVYTPYVINADHGVTEDGWLYGESIDYPYLNEAFNIKLDPGQKSDIPISTDGKQSVTDTWDEIKWGFRDPRIGPNIQRAIAEALGIDVYNHYEKTSTFNAWNYTGYRYEFDPMLPFQLDEEGNKKPSAADGKLSIVWYNYGGHEGISGGLIIYGQNDVLLASYSASDIIGSYNAINSHSTKYVMNFNGVLINLNVRFDPDVINSGKPLGQAWTDGDWSIAFTSLSAGNFLDLKNSTSFSTSVGSMVETFVNIFTFDVPDLPLHYAIFLWLLVALPGQLAILLFCSRFGVAGIAGGLLASALLFGVG